MLVSPTVTGRRLFVRRAVPMAVLGAVAFGAGAVVGAGNRPAEEALVERFVRAWERDDYAAMHAELTADDRRARTVMELARAYRRAAATATARTVRAGTVGPLEGGVVAVPMTIRTRIFGTLHAPLRLPLVGDGEEARIDWAPHLTFPGVRRGARLERRTELPPRADLLARDGTPLAEGSARTSPLGPAAAAVAGQLGRRPPQRAMELRALGHPADAPVGVSGLERVFDRRLAGRPGGVLRTGGHVLARTEARPATNLRTTIAPGLQRAAVGALGDRVGGIAALRPRTGEILALSGIAFSGLQPPGSTFKIITLAGVLEAKIAGPDSTFPVQTSATIEGVEIENANGESCGGSLRSSFAHSCNSVFAPLGARLGAERLVRTAEAFGFNRPPGIPGAATSTIPAPDEIGDDLAIGSSAIGQGRVQSTALQMAWIAATIAGRGRRPRLTLERRRIAPAERVIDLEVARLVERYMLAVVREGTGTAAAIAGVRVAGKTGTAELRDTTAPECTPTPERPQCPTVEADPTDTDAWFAAYAPAGRPRLAVGVLLVGSGAGGETAAPAAKQVLQAGL